MIVIISSHGPYGPEPIRNGHTPVRAPGHYYLSYKIFQDNGLAEAWKEELLDGGFVEKEEIDEYWLEPGEFTIKFEIKVAINIPRGHYYDR